ncbi:MAG TPA: hypothetical protein VIJ11_04405 [Galbitalea sp.]
MPLPLAGTITLAAAGVGAAALVVALVIPTPAPAGGTWLDYPTAGANVATGLTQFTAHASAPDPIDPVTAFRFELSDAAGDKFPVENDQHPSVNGTIKGLAPRTLFFGRVLWEAKPGSYSLVEGYLAEGKWTYAPAVAFTVPGEGSTPTPVQTPTPTPTSTPTPGATPTPTPTPTASATASPPPTPAPTGQVRITSQTHTQGGNTVSAQAYDVTPVNGVVDIQLQIVVAGQSANPNGIWTSEGCGNLGEDSTGPVETYACSTTMNASNPFHSSAATGWLRVQVTVGTTVTTSYGPSFGISANIH